MCFQWFSITLLSLYARFTHLFTIFIPDCFLKYSNGEATYTQYITRILAGLDFSPLSWSQLPYSWLLNEVPVTGLFYISFSWLSSQYLGFNFSFFFFLKEPYIFLIYFFFKVISMQDVTVELTTSRSRGTWPTHWASQLLLGFRFLPGCWLNSNQISRPWNTYFHSKPDSSSPSLPSEEQR